MKDDVGVQKLMVKGGAAVDPESGLDSKAHLLQVTMASMSNIMSPFTMFI